MIKREIIWRFAYFFFLRILESCAGCEVDDNNNNNNLLLIVTVAALIYWRDPKKSGIVFGAILGVLLSLAYFSLISVLAYISLLTLTFTVAFRIYKTVLQAIQKTSDGHPFK